MSGWRWYRLMRGAEMWWVVLAWVLLAGMAQADTGISGSPPDTGISGTTTNTPTFFSENILGTLTITPPSGLAPAIITSQNGSGVPTDFSNGGYAFNKINIQSDTVSAAGGPVGSTNAIGLTVFDSVGGIGTSGNRIAVLGYELLVLPQSFRHRAIQLAGFSLRRRLLAVVHQDMRNAESLH